MQKPNEITRPTFLYKYGNQEVYAVGSSRIVKDATTGEQIGGYDISDMPHNPGSHCAFTEHITCFRENCFDCPTFFNRNEMNGEKFCLKCGADIVKWKEAYNEDHRCYVGKDD